MQEYIKILESGKPTTLKISNDEMKDIIEIVESLEDSGLLSKGVSEAIQNEGKEQKGGFLSMLLGTLGASLLGNILAGKGINRAGEGALAKRQSWRDKVEELQKLVMEKKKGRKATTKRQGHKNKKDF